MEPDGQFGCECGYRSDTPGPCRSHPYPCRGMGPEMKRVERRDQSLANKTARLMTDVLCQSVAASASIKDACVMAAQAGTIFLAPEDPATCGWMRGAETTPQHHPLAEWCVRPEGHAGEHDFQPIGNESSTTGEDA